MNTVTAKSRKSGYHHNDLPSALIEAALVLILERGGPSFSLRELAAKVGVTHPSVYRHFKDKAALLDALMRHGFDELRRYQRVEQGRAPQTPLEQLMALARAYIRFAQDNAGFFSLMFGNAPVQDDKASGRSAFNRDALAALLRAIQRCQEAGILIPGSPLRIAGFLVLAPHGLANYTAHDDADPLTVMDIEEVAWLSLVPFLVDRPSSEEISRTYLAGPANDPR